MAPHDFLKFPARRFYGVCAGVVGGVCGAQMALLCLWNFELGFWLGVVGWQLAVTAVYLHATSPQREGRLTFWPSPPQLS